MKLTPSRLAAFLRRPEPGVRAVLVYGRDQGLARERAVALVTAVAGDPPDPFRIVDVTAASVRADPVRLMDEAASLSFSGGRRVVRIRDANDAVTEVLRAFLKGPNSEALIVVEAGDLGPRSPLRQLFESASDAVVIPCYGDDEGTLRELIVETLAAHGLRLTDEAAVFLTANLGADRGITRSEVEKLALYMGKPGTVTLEDAIACAGDYRSTSLDLVAYAAGGGDFAVLDRALTAALAEGEQPVTVLRAVANHLQRLHLARALVRQGQPLKQAMGALKPPVFFKLQSRFQEQMSWWSDERLAAALAIVTEAEVDCKTTGNPADVITGRALMRIAQAAGRSSARR